MNRNNVVYNWQFNRNPFIDQPELVEYIWGNMIGETWDQPLSVDENNFSEIAIYPNPATDKIYINGLEQGVVISILSLEGKILQSQRIEPNTSSINLNLHSGLYLLKVQLEGESIVRKLIIK
jgi:hypothetical protein